VPFSIKAITPPAGTLAPRKYAKAVLQARGIAETVGLQEARAVTRGWKHKPAWKIERRGDDSNIVTDDPVFLYQDQGTGTHAGKGKYLIRPVRKRALKFKNGAIRAWAWHPGVKANHYTEKIAATMTRQYVLIVAREIAKVTP